MSKVYDYKTLIELSVSQKRYFSIPVYGDYYKTLIGTLEKLLDTPLEPPSEIEYHHRTLWVLFEEALTQARKGGIGSGYLVGGPMSDLGLLWRDGVEQALKTAEVWRELQQKEKAVRDDCRALAYELFKLFYGEKLEKTVTSEALLAAGFDDSQEPDLSDYYDHL